MSTSDIYEGLENELDHHNDGSAPNSFFASLLCFFWPQFKNFQGIPDFWSEIDFQTKLITFLIAWLIFNLIAIYFAWKKYGDSLCTFLCEDKNYDAQRTPQPEDILHYKTNVPKLHKD